MGSAPSCRACGHADPTVLDRAIPFGPRCAACWAALQADQDTAQARDEGADGPPPPAAPRCPRCGVPQERRETGYGRWVLLEPDMPVPAHLLPAGHRWIVAEDGIALNTGGRALPTGTLGRIPHALVCPRGEAPVALAPFFTALWQENRRRHRRSQQPPPFGDFPHTDTAV